MAGIRKLRKFNITINDLNLTVDAGISIMKAALDAGIYIPGICYHSDLTSGGNMRFMCCGHKGANKPAKACKTPVEEGMVIQTDLWDIKKIRQEKLSKILATHPHACLTCAHHDGCSSLVCSANVDDNERCCPKLGRCEFQKVANYIGIKVDTESYIFKNLPKLEEPLILRDLNLCIGCQRCLRVCKDVRGVEALRAAEIAGNSVVLPTSKTLAESGCRFCTACVEVCPTGALMDGDLAKGLSHRRCPYPLHE
jgi:formate dehydrogenase (NADP+) beta subunit